MRRGSRVTVQKFTGSSKGQRGGVNSRKYLCVPVNKAAVRPPSAVNRYVSLNHRDGSQTMNTGSSAASSAHAYTHIR